MQSGERSLSWDKKMSISISHHSEQHRWMLAQHWGQYRVESPLSQMFECSSSSIPQADEPIPRGLAQGTQPLELAEGSGGTLGWGLTVGTWCVCYCPSKEEEEVTSPSRALQNV